MLKIKMNIHLKHPTELSRNVLKLQFVVSASRGQSRSKNEQVNTCKKINFMYLDKKIEIKHKMLDILNMFCSVLSFFPSFLFKIWIFLV